MGCCAEATCSLSNMPMRQNTPTRTRTKGVTIMCSAAFCQQRVFTTPQRKDADWLLGVFKRYRQSHAVRAYVPDIASTAGGSLATAPRSAVFRSVRAFRDEFSPGVQDDWLIDRTLGAVVLEPRAEAAYHHANVVTSPQ